MSESSKGLCAASIVQSSFARDSEAGENSKRAQTKRGVSTLQPKLMRDDVGGMSGTLKREKTSIKLLAFILAKKHKLELKMIGCIDGEA